MSRPRVGGRLWRRLLPIVVVAQLVLIASAGIGAVAGLPIWAFTDERAHAAYVDAVGAGRLPVMGKEQIPAEVAAVRPAPAGPSYESFQPPLYYVVAAIPWDMAKAVGGVAFAGRFIRALDLVAFAASIGLLWVLALRVTRRREEALAAFAIAATYVFWSGVVFRGVTVSNMALEMPLSAAALLALWIAWNERSTRALIASSVLCGLGLLCRLPFPPVVLLPVVAWRFRRIAPRAALVAVALPVVLLAPWLVDNVHRYGALTAATVVRHVLGFLNPGGKPYGLRQLGQQDVSLLNGMLPEEWASTTLFLYTGPHSLPLSVLHALRVALVALVLVPLGFWVSRGPRRAWLLVAPLAIGLVFTQVDTLLISLPLSEPRYLYPVLPAFGLAGGLALVRAFGLRATAVVAGAITAGLAGLWIYLITTVPPIAG